jgi:hypothetical protein
VRVVQQAQMAASSALQAALDTPSGRAMAASRCEAALRARFLTVGEARRRSTAHDPTVRAAANLLAPHRISHSSSRSSSSSVGIGCPRTAATYAAALEAPVRDEDSDRLRPPVAGVASKAGGTVAAGYEPLGQCLPLQICNEREFVYLALT